jgi:hypothetical protein
MMMDDYLRFRFGQSKSDRTAAPDYGVDGVRPLRHQSGEFVEMLGVFDRSYVAELHGKPYPVQWRSQGAEQAWAQAIGNTDVWRQWAMPETSWREIKQDIMWQLERNPLTLEPGESSASVLQHQTVIVGGISVNLMYCRHGGTVIEATPALEALLTNSDVDLGLPMSMVAPPYAAQYVRFGETVMRHLKVPGDSRPGQVFDGAFCFLSPSTCAGRWNLELVFIVKLGDCYIGQVVLTGLTDRGDMSIGEWMDAGQPLSAGQSPDNLAAMHAAVSYVVKLFLYMGLKHARRIERNEYDEALRRAKGLGNRKGTKLLKRAESLYNAIVVGPETLPTSATFCGAGTTVAPHWRRGHFRMQPHGPGRQERKLIFVAPVLIHAEQLQSGAPTPRTYCADA